MFRRRVFLRDRTPHALHMYNVHSLAPAEVIAERNLLSHLWSRSGTVTKRTCLYVQDAFALLCRIHGGGIKHLLQQKITKNLLHGRFYNSNQPLYRKVFTQQTVLHWNYLTPKSFYIHKNVPTWSTDWGITLQWRRCVWPRKPSFDNLYTLRWPAANHAAGVTISCKHFTIQPSTARLRIASGGNNIGAIEAARP